MYEDKKICTVNQEITLTPAEEERVKKFARDERGVGRTRSFGIPDVPWHREEDEDDASKDNSN
jgi:hypothetical protein